VLVRHGADAGLQPQHDSLRRGSLTPAKRVALGGWPTDRLQYPGDALNVILFHDSAE